MFVVGGALGEKPNDNCHESLFLEGYGTSEINLLALAYYRYEWLVAEVGSWGQSVVDTTVGAITRQQALHYFKAQFAPGNVVDAATQTDAVLKTASVY
jgi:spectinomycin phosphotransferase